MASHSDSFYRFQSHSAFSSSKRASDNTSIGNFDLISTLERKFCSNFVCITCYVKLPSLHDLFDHLDEAHMRSNGSSLAYAPSVPPHSFEHSPAPHALADDHSQHLDVDCPALSSAVLSMLYNSDTDDFYPYKDTLRMDYYTTCDAEHLSQCPPLRHPLPRSERPPGPFYSENRSRFASVEPLPAETEPEEKPPVSEPLADRSSSIGPMRAKLRSREHRHATSPLPHKPASKSKAPPRAAQPQLVDVVGQPAIKRTGVKKASKKDQIYKCPTLGCTKSYRNPNGLKYHTEKGKCTVEESTEPLTLVTPQPPTSVEASCMLLRPIPPSAVARNPLPYLPAYTTRPMVVPSSHSRPCPQSSSSSSSSSPSSPSFPVTPQDIFSPTPLRPGQHSLPVKNLEMLFMDLVREAGEMGTHQMITLDGEDASPLLLSTSSPTPNASTRSLSPLMISSSTSSNPFEFISLPDSAESMPGHRHDGFVSGDFKGSEAMGELDLDMECSEIEDARFLISDDKQLINPLLA